VRKCNGEGVQCAGIGVGAKYTVHAAGYVAQLTHIALQLISLIGELRKKVRWWSVAALESRPEGQSGSFSRARAAQSRCIRVARHKEECKGCMLRRGEWEDFQDCSSVGWGYTHAM
jgi:hypothetical protein